MDDDGPKECAAACLESVATKFPDPRIIEPSSTCLAFKGYRGAPGGAH
jgi:hypothetical protein